MAGSAENVTLTRISVADNSYAAVTGHVGCQTSLRVPVQCPQSSLLLDQRFKKMKFHRRSSSCTVGFISDSQFKFFVEDDQMQALIFQQNYKKTSHFIMADGDQSGC